MIILANFFVQIPLDLLSKQIILDIIVWLALAIHYAFSVPLVQLVAALVAIQH
jgi:hypothetical protein